MFLKLFMIIILCTFSIANSEKDYYDRLLNSKQYDKAYKELIRLQNLKDGSFRTWTYTKLGLLYEFGNGVQKNQQKAYNAYSVAAMYGVPYALTKLGYYHENGIVVKKDKPTAFKYFKESAAQEDFYGMYFLGDYYLHGKGGAERNPIAAKAWLEKAAKKKTYAKKLLDKSTFDTKSFIQKRKSQIQQLSKDQKLFSIALGEPLYPELEVETTPSIHNAYVYSWYESSLRKSVLQNYLQRDEKNLLHKLYSKINVYTTPLTHSVYEIDGFFDFDSQSSCKRELTNFLQNIQSKSNKRTSLSNFSRAKKKHESYEYRFLDIGIKKSPTNTTGESIEEVKDLQGKRFIAQCFDGGKGLLRAVDFSAFELRIAEEIEKDLFFNYLGKNRAFNIEYLQPFGISLLASLPKGLQTRYKGKSESIGLYKDANVYSITPPKPLKHLNSYEVTTSKLTNSVVSIKAEGTFKDKEMCQIAMGTTAQNIFEHYSKSKQTLNWYNAKHSNPNNLFVEFCLTPRGFQQNCPDDFDFTIYGPDYTPSIRNVQMHIACDGKKGVLQARSQYGTSMAQKESDLLSTHERD